MISYLFHKLTMVAMATVSMVLVAVATNEPRCGIVCG